MSEHIVEVSEWVIDINGNPPFMEGEEIVRCKDCRYYDTAGPWCYEPSKIYIDEYGIDVCATVKPDGYCAWGERRD